MRVADLDEIHLVAHGSPDPRHAASIAGTAERVAQLAGTAATFSFLEHDEPRTSAVLAPAGSERGGSTHQPRHSGTRVVLPLLLTAGIHWHRDIPPVLAGAGQRTILLAPPALERFAEAVLAAVAATAAGPDARSTGRDLAEFRLVLASAGSRLPEVSQRMHRLADGLVRLATATDSPFRSVAVAERPDTVAELATDDTLVVPVLVADGLFADRIRQAAARRGAVVTPVLGQGEPFARCLVDDVEAALRPPAS